MVAPYLSTAPVYIADQDTDKHKTIEDQMQLRSKVRLMKQFQWGVAAYVIAKAAVIMVPALVWVEPGDAAFRTIYILQNSVRWLFLAALCWIFRRAFVAGWLRKLKSCWCS